MLFCDKKKGHSSARGKRRELCQMADDRAPLKGQTDVEWLQIGHVRYILFA